MDRDSLWSVEVRLENAVLAVPLALRHVIEICSRKDLFFHVVEELVRLRLISGREGLVRKVIIFEFNEQ